MEVIPVKLNIKLSKTKLIIICLSIITLIAGTTYAIITWNSNNTKLAGNTMCFDIAYTQGQDINFGTVNSSGVVVNGMTASLDFDESTSASTTVTFQRKPNCELYGIGTIKANISVSPNNVTMSKGGLNYVIKNNNTSATVKTGTITQAGTTTIYDNFIINESITYTIYFWLDADYIDNTYLEATFSGTIESSAISTTEYGEIDETYEENIGEGTIYYQLASNAVADNVSSTYVTSSTGIDFASISSDTNGKGVYLRSGTEEYLYPIYYYRGNVDNNLIFAGFCWKIVRTTETGGIKLIYNGIPSGNTCNNTGTASQISTKAFNTNYNSPAYVGYMYGTPYLVDNQSMSSTTTIAVGNSVTYSNGQYTLKTSKIDTWANLYDGGLDNYHYTCLTTGTTCTEGKVYYIYETNASWVYYLTLTGGKNIEIAIDEMLNYNTTSSTIKGNSTTEGTIDYWYATNIAPNYSSYIEDTIWCNDRSLYSLGPFDPNGGPTLQTTQEETQNWLMFKSAGNYLFGQTPNLTCPRDIDKFTVNTGNGNGDLDYPVGLLTIDEIRLAGGGMEENSTYYLYTGQDYWGGSPVFVNYAVGSSVWADGYLGGSDVNGEIGVRPSVSLKPGFTIAEGGTGTASNPYVVG